MDGAAKILRHFNRTYTQRIGALQESFLGLGLPLASARLLWEIGPEGAVVLALRERLELDSGYLSRLLRDLQRRGLLHVEHDSTDRRRRRASLTPRGRQTFRRLEDRSEALARELLEPLSDRQQQRLAAALGTAELLVRAATVQISEVELESPLLSAAVDRYFAELDRRFPGGFDAEQARTADAAQAVDGRFVVAVSEGRSVGCGALHPLDPPTSSLATSTPRLGEIKRMWIDPDWRGVGLGSRLLRHLEGLAARVGYEVVRLDTNRTLSEAIELYRRSGYRSIERYNTNPYAQAWFEKEVR
jgi:DNA-binding MarR family transcriptional regulator/GNAT superfamily N-acetyltransferase